MICAMFASIETIINIWGLKMTEETGVSESSKNHTLDEKLSDMAPTRRKMLMMGAVAASAVVSVRPAIAQTSGSILNCDIPVPGPHGAGQNIAPDGQLVPRDTDGSFTPSGRRYTGRQVKRALRGRPLPGTSYAESRAYTNYIRRLQAGQSGFTCYAS